MAQLQPRIDHIMDGIDEAAAVLEATPEYQVFRDRLHALALVLQEAGTCWGHKDSGGRAAPAVLYHIGGFTVQKPHSQ